MTRAHTRPVGDVVVAGGGPAGRAVSRACAARGLDVTLVDPHPDAAWPQTYGAWAYDLPADLPAGVVAACDRGTAVARATHELDDHYAVFDTAALRRHLADAEPPGPGRDASGGSGGVRVWCGQVLGPADPGPGVALVDGTVLRAPVVVDATGAAQALSRRPGPRRGRRRAEQTAYGVVVDRDVAARVTGGRLVFMDWRPDHDHRGWPTFLYAIPLDADRVLLEETSLARRPALPLAELRARLHARLAARGLDVRELPDTSTPEGRARTERVRFPVDLPRHDPPPGVVAVGAAAPWVHPATGFSLTASLHRAPRLAAAVAAALDGRTAAGTAAEAARRAVDGSAAAVVHAMRRRGLDVLLRMPPADVPGFFDAFFALPAHHRRAYLSAHEDVPASFAAMTALFARLPTRQRLDLVRGTLLGPGPTPG